MCLFIVDVEYCSEDSFQVEPDLSVVMANQLHADTFHVAFDLLESRHYSESMSLTSLNKMFGLSESLMRLIVSTTGTAAVGSSNNIS